ncbi:hypothetical protein CHS0354_012021 [Potamilus streckersoni]|uniref:Alpha/beta hydrolase fold-3 domain-containing protein n=1 Tax=Potamilus streckersoni TaxID=2493646 RepID=A0AAE0RU74_9BIVA|nr:hypothetical protein CHS0354_012021 [Potamilus streckersoni]
MLTYLKVWREEFDGVTVRISKPITLDQTNLSPAIVYIHGGGWVVLDTDSYAHLTDTISLESEVVVVSIEYRLAPEHMYPVPLDDCVKATKFFLKNAKQYGVDENQIGIAGDSAGGNLAMSVALRLSEELESPQLAAQGLIYPVLQGINFLLPSYIQNSNGPAFITGDTMAEYFLSYMIGDWKYQSHFLTNNHTSPAIKQSEYARYVSHELLPDEFQAILEDDYGDNYGDEDVSQKLERFLLDSNFAPLMATDGALAKLPPTCLVTTNFDVLRDDGFLLEKRLKRMGRDVTHQYYSGYEHGFLMHLAMYDGSLPAVRRFCKCMLTYIKS